MRENESERDRVGLPNQRTYFTQFLNQVWIVFAVGLRQEHQMLIFHDYEVMFSRPVVQHHIYPYMVITAPL